MGRADTPTGTRPALQPGRGKRPVPSVRNQVIMQKNKTRTVGWFFMEFARNWARE